MSDDKKYIPGKVTLKLPLTRQGNPALDLRVEDFNTPNEFLHHVADMLGDPELKKRAEAGEGAWVTSRVSSGPLGIVHIEELPLILEEPLPPPPAILTIGPPELADTITRIKMTHGARVAPMERAVEVALDAARRSPCRKSKRGAVVFQPFTGYVCAGSCNSRPDGHCDDRCYQPYAHPRELSVCAQLCVHAEARAIRWAVSASERSLMVADYDFAFDVTQCEIVHVKVNAAGELVPSGPPSCVFCAKEIADVGLVGVWLFESRVRYQAESELPFAPIEEVSVDAGEWRFYLTRMFWDRTLKELRL